MPLSELAAASLDVGATPARTEKVRRLADLLAGLPPEEVELGVAYLSGEVPGPSLGIGPALVQEALAAARAGEGALAGGAAVDDGRGLPLREVAASLREVATLTGPGSRGERARRLTALFARAGDRERRFLAGLLLGELRQGALAGVMEEAVARAAGLPAADVRRAAMLSGSLPAVAQAALQRGAAGLAAFGVQLFRPVQPMLAQTAEDVGDALSRLTEAALEHKLDGARVQVHKAGPRVAVYTRALNDVTASVPEIVEAVSGLPAERLVLDGEAIAWRPDGRPHPFQVTMRRFGRKLDVPAARAGLPLSVSFFDVLHREGEDVLDRPARERWQALSETVPGELLVPRLLTADPRRAAAFLDDALRRGHEGLMAKAPDAAYAAGRRGAAWLKVKPAHTLDLVVLAAEWGHGRRAGWLSNLHLGARDPATGGFVMLGKTFKGLTDELLRWQTQALLQREVARQGGVVFVRPELVVEIAVNELQESPRYPGGLALRFARVKRYRADKRGQDADTIETVRALHEGRLHRDRA